MAAQRTQNLKVTSPTASSSGGGTEEYNRQLQQAETQLEKLQQQREEIERKRLEAEEISDRRQDFIDGQIEILEKLDHSVQAIDREIFESRQELKELEEARKTFATHLQTLQGMDPRKWKKTKLAEEVQHAMDVLEDCETDYEEISASISEGRRRGFLAGKKGATSESFSHTLKQGFAFNLPVLLLGSIALLVFLTR
jgi:DNA repair exonuclease SbcCD ATPase subunit